MEVLTLGILAHWRQDYDHVHYFRVRVDLDTHTILEAHGAEEFVGHDVDEFFADLHETHDHIDLIAPDGCIQEIDVDVKEE